MINKPIVVIDFNGPDGNTMAIVGICSRAASKAGWSREAVDGMVEDMLSDDREHVLDVVYQNFEVMAPVKEYRSVGRGSVT
jgi:hypothetical protein